MTARFHAGLGLGLVLCCCAGVAGADQSVSSAAGQSQPLLDSGVSARALGLGNAMAAFVDDGTALWFNPAGLARQASAALGLHHDNELVDTLRETAVLGLPLGPGQGAALALDYVSYGEFAATTDQGFSDGSFSAGETALLAGYGFTLWPGFSLGGQGRYSQQRLADLQKNLWQGSGGLLFRPWEGDFSLGLDWSAEQDDAGAWQTRNVNAGLAWRPVQSGDRPLTVSLQGQWLSQDRSQLTLGAEWHLSSVATLRGSWQAALYQDSAGGGLGIWCVGAGLTDRTWSLDYGVVTDHPLGVVQRLSLAYAFAGNATVPSKEPLAVPVPAAAPAAMPTPLAMPAPALSPTRVPSPVPAPAAEVLPAAAPVDPTFGLAGALPSAAYVAAFQAAQAGRTGDALALCRRGVTDDPSDGLCWREMGLLYDQLNHPDYAQTCMAACLRVLPRDAVALQWMQSHAAAPAAP